MSNLDSLLPDSLELLAMFETAAAQAAAAYAEEEEDSLDAAFQKAASAATVDYIISNKNL
jgi:hypothetical protein